MELVKAPYWQTGRSEGLIVPRFLPLSSCPESGGWPKRGRMSVGVDLGMNERGQAVALDLGELLSTRLLVQGNSGSGKSHLLRRLLEGSAGTVQQVVIDPEGDFV